MGAGLWFDSRLATWEDVATFLAALPGADFDPGAQVFPRGVVRVRGKVVAYPGGARGTPDDAKEGEEFLFVKAGPAERAALMAEDPHTFFLTPHYRGSPGVIVRLGTVADDHLRELLVEAWRQVAPKRLQREYDETPG